MGRHSVMVAPRWKASGLLALALKWAFEAAMAKQDFSNLLSTVKEHVETFNRGMETFRLQAQGFSKSDIQDAIDAKVLESRRGRTGGIYPYGMVPEAEKVNTLKSQMADFIRNFIAGETPDMDTALNLISAYEAECQKRSDAKKKNTDNDD
jgi:hypothetical protein